MRGLICAIGLFALGGCVTPPTPMEKLSNAAYDMNNATRFGRLDIAASHVVGHARQDFMARHRQWGRDIRIVDVDLAGMSFITTETAAVNLAISWHRIDSSEMQTSFVSQKWTSTGEGWQLSVEERAGGAPGLFAPPPPSEMKAKKAPNVFTGQL